MTANVNAMETQASAPRVRVLFLDHTALLSGGELALYSLVEQLDRTRYEPIVLLCQHGPLEEKISKLAETHTLPLDASVRDARKDSIGWNSLLHISNVFITLRYIHTLKKKIQELRPDIIHTNSLKADVLGGIAARMLGIPLVWHIRDRIDVNYLPKTVVHVFRSLCRVLPDRIISNSNATQATLHLPPGKRSDVINSGFDVERFRNAGASREPLAAVMERGGPVNIGLVGRISPWKGQDVFLHAARRVHDAFPQTRFFIIGAALFGEEAHAEKLHALTSELGLQDAVTFTGFQENVAEAIGNLDMVVHASVIPEPFGQVIAQGMAAGKPVVATRGGGASEIVQNGVNGLLVTPGNAEEMADGMVKMLRDPHAAALLAQKGQAGALKAFSSASVARRVEALYDDLLRSGRGGKHALPVAATATKKPIRILHYNTTASVSGAEVVLLNILREVDRGEIESVVVCPQGPLTQMAADLGVKVVSLEELQARFTKNPLRLPSFLRSIFSSAINVRRVVRETNPDLVHANSIRAGIVSTLATIGMRVPIAWHLHDTLPQHPFSPVIRTLAACSRRSSFIAVSTATLAAFCGVFWRDRLWKAGTVILNGVDASRYQPQDGVRSRMRQQLGIREDQFCIAHIGQVIPRKDQLGMVEAFSLVRTELPDATLLMIGTPVFESGRLYAEKVKNTVKDLRLEESVHLLGFRKDIPEIMQTCDLLVMNSLADPCPLTVLEGMAMEAPVLASAVDGIPELVTNHKTGWLCPPNAPSDLAQEIRRIAAMPVEQRKAVAHRARTAILEQHSLTRYVDQFAKTAVLSVRRFHHAASAHQPEPMPWMPLQGDGR